MKAYVILLRGINVGGKNKIPMADLRGYLTDKGYIDVSTYIASGNVLLKTDQPPVEIKETIEILLPREFKLDSELIKALVLDTDQLRSVVDNRPPGFGDQPDKYHSDAIFTIDVSADDVMPIFKPREGVDAVWAGNGVIYSQRLSAERAKSRLGIIAMSPLYKSLTIRSWNTTVKLLQLVEDR